MKKLLIIVLLLNAFLLADRFRGLLSASAVAGGEEGRTSLNADCNGDGVRDLTDVIYLLDHLFRAGPAPVALASGDGLTPEEREILSHFRLVEIPTGEATAPSKTIRLSGVNLQIVNGEGRTDTANGVGNLIVGYQETRGSPPDARDFRGGSHNLIVGRRHSYNSFGGFLAGDFNTILGEFSSVSGGYSCTALGGHSAVGGGFGNTSRGNFSSVSGGYNRSVIRDSNWRGGNLDETQ